MTMGLWAMQKQVRRVRVDMLALAGLSAAAAAATTVDTTAIKAPTAGTTAMAPTNHNTALAGAGQ